MERTLTDWLQYTPGTRNLAFGSMGAGSNDWDMRTGMLDDFQIYDHVLSEQEVKDIYMCKTDMFPPKANSPATHLSSSITSTATSITVADASMLPDAPNVCSIGRGNDTETIKYTGKSGNTLTGVTREFESGNKAWDALTPVARVLTAQDITALQTAAAAATAHADSAHAPADANNYSHPSSIQCNPATLTAGTGITGSNYDGKAARTWSVSYGTSSSTACVGNDSRLSDARTPTAHTHGNISNTGALGTTANLPLITGTSGVIQASSFGTTANTFCEGNDSRLSDSRPPTAHNHTLANITDSGNLAALSTNSSTSNYLRGDGTWVTPPNTTYSEISTAEIDTGTSSTARAISGRRAAYIIGKSAPLSHNHSANDINADVLNIARIPTGSTSSTVCIGNDSRLSDARTPTAHTHGNISNTGAIGTTANLPLITTTSGVVTTGSFGTSANTFCVGNDARLSDARTPTAHTHTLANITDSGNLAAINTNSSTSNYLRGDGTWVTPPNTTYSEISTAEIDAGTASTLRTITGRRAGYIIGKCAPVSHNHSANDITSDTLNIARIPTGTTSSTVCIGNDSRLSDSRTPLSHTHGNISNTGAIGTTANLPLITTTSGVVTTGSFGTGANTFCVGNDSRLSDARTPLAHTLASHSDTSGYSNANPLMNGTVSQGSSDRLSRQDHVHPVDTSRAASSHNHNASDINAGTLPVGRGGTGATSFTAGRVLYGNGTSALGNSADLFWNNSSTRLGVGTASPGASMDISVSGGGSTSGLTVGSSNGRLNIWGGASSGLVMDITNGTLNGSTGSNLHFRQGGTDFMRVLADGKVSIGNIDPSTELHVDGTITADKIIIGNYEIVYNSSTDTLDFRRVG